MLKINIWSISNSLNITDFLYVIPREVLYRVILKVVQVY
jgi:hypothetical protein